MSEGLTQNAIISSASVVLDRECFLSVHIDLDLGDSSGQSFGGSVLGGTNDVAAGKHGEQPNYAAEFLVRCMQIAGVSRWADMPGKTIRVKKAGWFEPITAIGHIVNDDWFEPKEAFERLKSARTPA